MPWPTPPRGPASGPGRPSVPSAAEPPSTSARSQCRARAPDCRRWCLPGDAAERGPDAHGRQGASRRGTRLRSRPHRHTPRACRERAPLRPGARVTWCVAEPKIGCFCGGQWRNEGRHRGQVRVTGSLQFWEAAHQIANLSNGDLRLRKLVSSCRPHGSDRVALARSRAISAQSASGSMAWIAHTLRFQARQKKL